MVKVCPWIHIVFFVNKILKVLFPEDRVDLFPDFGISVKDFTGFLVYGITG
jgi:hypothetical protein